MNSYLAICEDQGDASAQRAEHLREHLAYVETILDRIQVAGPLREDAGPEVAASCFIYGAETLEEAQALLAGDPYFKAGIYASVRWFHLNPAAGTWVGGRNW